MNRFRYLLLTCLIINCLSTSAWAVRFSTVGDLPGGYTNSRALAVSADGSAVVGWSNTHGENKMAFLWTAQGGIVPLGDLPGGWINSEARAVSNGGTVVVGTTHTDTGTTAFRWTPETGMQPFDMWDQRPGEHYSEAIGISADGTTIIGHADSSTINNRTGFKWTAATGMVALGIPSWSFYYNQPMDISADGSTIVGSSSSGGGYRLTSDGYEAIGNLAGSSSLPLAVSADGSFIVGNSKNDTWTNREAFLWSKDDGMVGLGKIPGGVDNSVASGVSADGSVVVGSNGYQPFIYDKNNGMRDLKEVLTNEYKLDLEGWSLTSVLDMSDDGTTIVGYGIGPDGYQLGWVAVIPEPCSLAILASGAIIMIRRR